MKKIAVVGSINIDYVIDVPRRPQVGETILGGRYDTVPGGKGANQAYAGGKLGGSVVMLGAVGEDKDGRALCENLRSVGVDVSRIKQVPEENTGTAFISLDKQGNNSIVVIPGANKTVDIPYIDANMDVLEACDIVLFQLEIPMETVVYAARRAKEMGKTVVLDPAPARNDIPQELYRCVDFIKPNEVELGLLVGDPHAAEHVEEAARKLQGFGPKNVVVTLGGMGAFLLDEAGKSSFWEADKELEVVDTTAAGDSFTAALALGLSHDAAVEEVMALAIGVSNLVVTRKGAQTSIPTLEEVDRYWSSVKAPKHCIQAV